MLLNLEKSPYRTPAAVADFKLLHEWSQHQQQQQQQQHQQQLRPVAKPKDCTGNNE